MLPFTVEEFLDNFASYNQAIYPAQWLLLALAAVIVLLAIRHYSYSSKSIAALLALLWLWTGVVYHLVFFTRINKAAYLFGLLCIIQTLILFFVGVLSGRLNFHVELNITGATGGALIVYALIIYPALGYLLGHLYPRSPTFGAPCPTTIFTFGLLLWADARMPLYVLIAPFIWSLISLVAALSLGMREDVGLFVAGIVATLLIVLRNRLLLSLRRRAHTA